MPNFHGATRGTTTERGYGTPHMRSRAAAWPHLQDGAPCCICHRPMNKHAIERLRGGRTRSAIHYDHNDARDGYLGFSHAKCNRDKGAAKGGRIANAQRGLRNARVRSCIQCGQLFRAYRPEQTTCSYACRRAKLGPQPPASRTWTCRYCGHTGQQTGIGRDRRVCSRQSCKAAQRREHNSRHRDHQRLSIRQPDQQWQSRLW